jgi:activator of 2-hydroxyglutaryl-CoA dehydratase/predicted nucleotide-binding protein (sugar kinase/HSP70/actin superfamily)
MRGDATRPRHLGIDVGTETIKLVELRRTQDGVRCDRRELVEHAQQPLAVLRELLDRLDWPTVAAATVTGRFSRQVRLPRIPDKGAMSLGLAWICAEEPVTLVTIGSRGFSVLERHPGGHELLRTNSRCSQGTGSFLRQLVQRFGLTVDEASEIADEVTDPALLSGRCPVILKTDMTHLANAGVEHARILAGLFDAVCDNVQTLIRPGSSPSPVLLSGGVSRSRRVRRHFERFLEREGMTLLVLEDAEDALFVSPLGCALAAASTPAPVPCFEQLFDHPAPRRLDWLPPLSDAGERVERMTAAPALRGRAEKGEALLLGLDVGSTGSKLVALAAGTERPVWEGYTETAGDPVGAAQTLVHRFLAERGSTLPVRGFGVTGSGRQIAGSLLRTCFGEEAVYVVNEIVAHATGALSFDPRVDTIFEIGGQDAKYIRLEGGRIVDAAMNEACSAGTGSFIAELGQRLLPGADVSELGRRAFEASRGVGLGQHCSVFMAEVVDEALCSGVETDAILAGLYDAVVQNYLNRVKGSRDFGRVVFCQGMPFAAPALAAAVARRTGSDVVVPPSPGTVGALGIALLARGQLAWTERAVLDPGRLLEARIEGRDAFVCHSTKGCGGNGNRCRIERMTTQIDGVRQRFTWGGACSLHDTAAAVHKLPDGVPSPFREREELARRFLPPTPSRVGGPRVGLTDEFVLKGVLPLFVTFLSEIGATPVLAESADRDALKRGIARSNTPWCAPMQLYHGVISGLCDDGVDFLFLPRLRSLPRPPDATHSGTCPICQASPDLLRWDLALGEGTPVLSPTLDLGPEGWRGRRFEDACLGVAGRLGVHGRSAERALDTAIEAQEEFERRCRDLGERALAHARERDLLSVVVLGRPYTIYNPILNSNVPAILREQGALPIPLECYPCGDGAPVFSDMYWSFGQQALRAAHQIRRTPGVYAVLCSNYSCGPDSFNLHFLADVMAGKPFTVIETDGHSGDAGTRTRIEAFVHCAREHHTGELAADGQGRPAAELTRHHGPQIGLRELRRRRDRLLVPWVSRSNAVIAACLRGEGIDAEALPHPGPEELEVGRRHTSGKECLPLALTLGSVLRRIDREPDPSRRLSVLMPTTRGPCRFGCYGTVFRMVLERLGLGRRVSIWSPADRDYFDECGPATAAITLTGVASLDGLVEASRHHSAGSRARELAEEIRRRYEDELLMLIEREVARQSPLSRVFRDVLGGGLFGCRDLLTRAAAELAELGRPEARPVVFVTGEIYVRLDPFANGFLVEELERRGLRVHVTPLGEWLEYSAAAALRRGDKSGWKARLAYRLRLTIQQRCHRLLARPLELGPRLSAAEAVAAAEPYVNPDLYGEASLTVGGPVHEWSNGRIDGAVNVGPMECMPSRIAASQLLHVAERDGLPVLNLSMSGEPLDAAQLDGFAYEVRQSTARHQSGAIATPATSSSQGRKREPPGSGSSSCPAPTSTR